MTRLPPLFRYFGSKCRAAPLYPAPEYDTIVEPFAGGAGYSLLYPEHRVILVEKNPKVYNCWAWLLQASPEEIRALPIHEPGEKIHPSVQGPARDWIGFWNGIAHPQEKMLPSAGRKRSSYWNATIRDRSAETVRRIRHWKVILGDYSEAPNVEASWFIDPPYQKAGRHYLTSSKAIDFNTLARWCVTRRGQIMVCENEGADWLPFEPFANLHAAPRKGEGRLSLEALCTWRYPGGQDG